MRKTILLSCAVILAFGLSCSGEFIEPIQEPLAQESTLKTGEKIQLNGKRPLIVVMQGEQRLNKALKEIVPDDIASIQILKNSAATEAYGEDGKDGVVIITLKE